MLLVNALLVHAGAFLAVFPVSNALETRGLLILAVVPAVAAMVRLVLGVFLLNR